MSIFKDFFGEGDEDTILEENKQLRKKENTIRKIIKS